MAHQMNEDESEEITLSEDEVTELDQGDDSLLKDTMGYAKKIYYRIMFGIYFSFCFLLALSFNMTDLYNPSLIELLLFSLLLAMGFAIILPIFIIVSGFASGGLSYLIIAPISYAILNSSTKGIMKILGFDMDLLFPNLIGKTGYVSKRNFFGDKSKYPFSAIINNTGLYEDSIFYKNLFSVRSSEMLEIGMRVEVTQDDKWSLLSIIKHHPTLAVVPIPDEYNVESDEKVLESPDGARIYLRSESQEFLELEAKLGRRWIILQIGLVFLAAFLVIFGFYHSATCFLSDPPQCNTLMDGVPFFILSFILLTVAIRTEFRRTLPSQESLEKTKFEAASSRKVNRRMAVLFVTFSLLLSFAWYDENTDGPDREYIDLTKDCNEMVVGPDVNLVGADFSGMYLYGCDLSNRDLTGADFSGAHLKCVDFSNSILVGANFGATTYVDLYGDTVYRESPDIWGVTFDNADLSDANFNGTGYRTVDLPYYSAVPDIPCEWESISFRGANLTNADVDAYFSGNFRSRGNEKVIFDNAILDNANFVMPTSSRYSHVSMVNVSFIGTNISTTLPPGTNLSQSNMSEANFIYFIALDLTSCPLSLPENYGCVKIRDKKMIAGPSMNFSNKEINLWYVGAINNDFFGTNFSGLYLPNSIFQGVSLTGSNMSNTNLSNSNFSYSHKIYNIEYLGYLNYMDYDEENQSYIVNVLEEWGVDNFSDLKSLWSANLTDVNFTGSNLSYSDFSYSNMTGANLKNADLTGVKWYYTTCPDGTNSGKTGSCNVT